MSRAQVDWLDEICVLGHAIWWADKLQREMIVFTLNTVSDGYGIAFATQKDHIEHRGYTIKWTVSVGGR